jgi:MFS family permease
MTSTLRTLRLLIVPTYLPIMAGTIGLAMLVPVLPLYLKDQGLSIGATSVVLAGVGIGASLGGLPAGSALARFGERTTLIGSFVVMGVSTAVLGFTDTAAILVGARIFFGAANSALRLSRQTYVTRRVPTGERGRALSFVGGSYRFAFLIGPIIGGVLVDLVGFRTTFLVAAATATIGLVPVTLSEPNALPLLPEVAGVESSGGLIAGLRLHWRRLLIAGWVPFMVMLVREGRFVVLPLIAHDLGMTATQVGVIVTVSTAADLALFPAAGWIMDRFGRLRAAVPAFGLIAAGLVWLGLSQSTVQVVLAGALIGVGNGLSSGAMLTLGSDLAPADAPGPFLAGMSVMQDAGRIMGPLLVGIVGNAAGLGAASIALAVVMVAAIAWFVTGIGETSKQQSLRSEALRS